MNHCWKVFDDVNVEHSILRFNNHILEECYRFCGTQDFSFVKMPIRLWNLDGPFENLTLLTLLVLDCKWALLQSNVHSFDCLRYKKVDIFLNIFCPYCLCLVSELMITVLDEGGGMLDREYVCRISDIDLGC